MLEKKRNIGPLNLRNGSMEKNITWHLSSTLNDVLDSRCQLKPQEAQVFRRQALWVSWASVVVTLTLAVAAFVVSALRYSASLFGFAIDALLDCVSSLIVVWRYYNIAAIYSSRREYLSCAVLGAMFLVSAICVEGKSIHNLSHKLIPEVDGFLLSVSLLSGVGCLLLAIAKFLLGQVLSSRVLITDAYNSLAGSMMGFSVLLSDEVFRYHPAVWYLDAVIGILIGLLVFCYGTRLLVDVIPKIRQTRNYERME
uniref:Transmembrane protein 163a n=1 Tax=Eptatretus burgeri TaxID=7764 RepID=A0A8C4R0H9_EPTBU